jgi:hypothetical protein
MKRGWRRTRFTLSQSRAKELPWWLERGPTSHSRSPLTSPITRVPPHARRFPIHPGMPACESLNVRHRRTLTQFRRPKSPGKRSARHEFLLPEQGYVGERQVRRPIRVENVNAARTLSRMSSSIQDETTECEWSYEELQGIRKMLDKN